MPDLTTGILILKITNLIDDLAFRLLCQNLGRFQGRGQGARVGSSHKREIFNRTGGEVKQRFKTFFALLFPVGWGTMPSVFEHENLSKQRYP